MTGKVELGFVEKAECPEELTSPYFPSKVGGRPAWLDPTHLPTSEQTACRVCGLPRTFLLQVYAPLEDTPSAFHRTFFLFMCLNPSCHQKNSAHGFSVFRCQLPKTNSFYEDSGEESSGDESASIGSESTGATSEPRVDIFSTQTCFSPSQPEAVDGSTAVSESLKQGPSTVVAEPTPLCVVCGSAGPKKCSRCRTVHYCSRHHQTLDWRNGHKLFCSDLAGGRCKQQDVTYDPSYRVCLPEFLLVMEEEPAAAMEEEEGVDRGEEDRMRDYHKFVKSGKYHDHDASRSGKKRVESVMEKAESGTMSDKVFRAFRRRVSFEPEQVIRYRRGGVPLLVSRDGAPQAADIPPCLCGAKRQFEFQVWCYSCQPAAHSCACPL
ncbi:Programmed cell death protein 2 [Geodia barretti]|uniref:Programmed cell death protein 2 n=1 Tax=Geodia barretti TaxID=519541 RepID=A0AA35SCC9_GEOBA|nr:Programmed cell death protein 2 [Geodia barretti]